MKPKFFIISLFAVMVVAISCQPNEPSAKSNYFEQYIDTLKLYYPYSLEQLCVFENAESNQKLEILSYDERKTGTFPYSFIEILDKECDCEEDQRFIIEGAWKWKEKVLSSESPTRIRTELIHERSWDNYFVEWNIQIFLNDEELYSGDSEFRCNPNEVLSHFTDSIIIPLNAPEGSYARIVKNQGLTDFSVDGKTVWKRVK